jgi:hypothetical protein
MSAIGMTCDVPITTTSSRIHEDPADPRETAGFPDLERWKEPPVGRTRHRGLQRMQVLSVLVDTTDCEVDK